MLKFQRSIPKVLPTGFNGVVWYDKMTKNWHCNHAQLTSETLEGMTQDQFEQWLAANSLTAPRPTSGDNSGAE